MGAHVQTTWFVRRVPGVTLLRGWLSAEDRVVEGVANADYEAVVTIRLQGPESPTAVSKWFGLSR